MPARSAGAAPVAVDAQRLVSAVADIFKAVGIAAEDAQVVAGDRLPPTSKASRPTG